jgi:polysaccharide pyruvyl transferase WcaK-like protein
MRIATIQGPLEIGVDYCRYIQASKMDQAAPPFFNPIHPHNTGDWFLTKIVDRLLDYDEVVLIKRAASDKAWDYINSECDALVLRGGNFIQPNFLTQHIGLETIRKIKIPIIVFGAGLQASFGEQVVFEPEEQEILHYIHANCAYSAVRGHSTAEALHQIGIDNVIVTGCPTVFWSRKPQLRVRRPHAQSAGFTFREGLYSSDSSVYRAQFQAIEAVRDLFGSVKVMLQGEEVLLQYYLQAYQWGAECRGVLGPVPGYDLQRIEKTPLDLDMLRSQIHRRFDQFSHPAFIDWFMNNTFFSWDITEVIRENTGKGMMVGCRLHGNLLTLANETPVFYLTYDRRTQELVDLMAIPGCRLVDFDRTIDVLGQSWEPFEQKYRFYYQEMVRFLETNGLKHRLQPTQAPVQSSEVDLVGVDA